MRHFGYEIENELYWHGWGKNRYEGWSQRIWTDLARNAQFIVDVGANTGVFALAAQAVAAPKARILAVEPVARVFEKMAENIALNGNRIESAQAALSDHDGTAVLHDLPAEHSYSSSLEQRFSEQFLGEWTNVCVEVPVARLDNLLAERGWPKADLLKIDVELHEPSVLRGMPKTLQNRPAMLIEVLLPDVGAEIMQLIGGLGYEVFEIDEAEGPKPCRTPGHRRGPPGFRNCLFLHPSTPLSRDGWPQLN
jgi:FkbM family methyltransferase